MVKTIKLSDETYQKLEELREKRDTFDMTVKRLLKVFEALHDVSETLGPSHYLKEVQHGPEKTRDLQVR